MSMTTTRFCAWCGIGATIVWAVGFFLFSGLVPAPSPLLSADPIGELFRHNPTQMRLGLVITCFGTMGVVPWVVAITTVMKRSEGRYHPLANLNLALGALLILEFCYPIFVWEAATYRPERSNELMQLMNDLAWIPYMNMVFSIIPQGLAIAFVILRDKREKPFYPRWVGYYTLFFVLTMVPDSLLIFFKTGWFAWDGLLSFWVGLSSYMTWTVILSVMTVKATYRIEQEDRELSIKAPSSDREAIRRVDSLSAEMEELRHEVGARNGGGARIPS